VASPCGALINRGSTETQGEGKVAVRIARPGIESSERLGRYRWVVERTELGSISVVSCTSAMRRADIHLAFLHPGGTFIGWNFSVVLSVGPSPSDGQTRVARAAGRLHREKFRSQ
jgi:hypothetical protein